MTSNDPSFDHKIHQAQAGGPDGIAALLNLYRPWLLRLAENDIRSKLRPALAASDVVQGSIILAVYAFPNFRGRSEAELFSWLRKIMRNYLVDRNRAASAKKRNIDNTFSVDREKLIDGETPSKIVSDREEGARLLRAISELDAMPRAVLELYYLKGVGFDAIANELSISRDKARRLWQRAIQILTRKLR